MNGPAATSQDNGLKAVIERSSATATTVLEVLENIDARLTGNTPQVVSADDGSSPEGILAVTTGLERKLSEILSRVTTIRDAL